MRNPRSQRPWSRTVARVLRVKGTVCHLCGQPGADTADHIVTVAEARQRGWTRSRTNALANLEPAHQSCNRARSTKPVDQARAELGPVPTSRDW